MVAKLQCEICGGKLIGKPGGIFECDSCGMEYDTAWAKAKIQEITGTVKVEGTVEVKGTVQVEGAASVYSLIKRGNLALEDAKWEDAKQCFNDVLNADPENAEAYFGLAMVESKSRSRDGFRHGYMYGKRMDYLCIKDLARAKQFGDEELKKWITELEEEKDKYLREEREKKEQLQKEQEAAKLAEAKRREAEAREATKINEMWKERLKQVEVERKKRIDALTAEQNTLRIELQNLKVLFNGKRRKEIENRLDQIAEELDKSNRTK